MENQENNQSKKTSTHFQELVKFSKNLRESSETTFENFRNPVFIVDLLGRLIYFNQAAELLMGYSRGEVLGRHFRLLFTLDDLSEGFLFFYQTLQGCYAEHSVFRVRRKDGSTRVLDVLASPISFQGRVRAGLAIAEDITGRSSQNPEDQDRVRVFKKFSSDLDRWNQEIQDSKPKDRISPENNTSQI